MSKTTIPTGGIADDAINLTSKVTGALPVANGGTALTSGFVNGGNTPSFLAYLTSSQTIVNNTNVHIQLNGEYFDTGGCYNNTSGTVTLNGVSAPLYSFAPNVAGKYFIGAKGRNDTSNDGSGTTIQLWKNGSVFSQVRDTLDNAESMFIGVLMDLDGTDDYVQMFQYQNSGSSTVANGTGTFGGDQTISFMFGYLIGGA